MKCLFFTAVLFLSAFVQAADKIALTCTPTEGAPNALGIQVIVLQISLQDPVATASFQFERRPAYKANLAYDGDMKTFTLYPASNADGNILIGIKKVGDSQWQGKAMLPNLDSPSIISCKQWL